jgi:hypothetical protein
MLLATRLRPSGWRPTRGPRTLRKANSTLRTSCASRVRGSRRLCVGTVPTARVRAGAYLKPRIAFPGTSRAGEGAQPPAPEPGQCSLARFRGKPAAARGPFAPECVRPWPGRLGDDGLPGHGDDGALEARDFAGLGREFDVETDEAPARVDVVVPPSGASSAPRPAPG